MERVVRVNITPHAILLLLTAVGGILLILYAGPLWRSLLIATMLAYLFDPLVNYLEQRWVGQRGLAVATVYGLAVALIAGLLYVAGLFIVEQAPGWSVELRQALTELRVLLERPFTLLNITIQPQRLTDYLQRTATNAFTNLPLGSGGWLGGIGDNLIWTLVTLISLYYLLRDGEKIVPALIRQLPNAYQAEATELASEIDHIWRVFLRVQLLIFAVLGVLIFISTTLILWLYRHGWLPLSPIGLILLLIGVYAAIQQVDNLWLRPQYMGQALQLHPGLVIVALLAALALTGVLGALIIVPLLASLKAIGQHWQRRWQNALSRQSSMGDSPTR